MKILSCILLSGAYGAYLSYLGFNVGSKQYWFFISFGIAFMLYGASLVR